MPFVDKLIFLQYLPRNIFCCKTYSLVSFYSGNMKLISKGNTFHICWVPCFYQVVPILLLFISSVKVIHHFTQIMFYL